MGSHGKQRGYWVIAVSMMELLILSIITFAGAYLQTVAGFGLVYFLSPALLVFFTPTVAVTITLMVASALCLLVLFGENRPREYSRRTIIYLVISAFPGLLLGGWIVTVIQKEVLQILLGVAVIGGALIQQLLLPKPQKPLRPTITSIIAGMAAGILNTSTSLGGPPLVIWLRSYITTRNQFRDTLAMIFLSMNILGIIIIYAFKHSSLNFKGIGVSLTLIPLTALGHYFGRSQVHKLSNRRYGQIIFWTVVAAGGISLSLGLGGLK